MQACLLEILKRKSSDLLPQIRLFASWAVLKGPVLLEKFVFDALTMVKQLGVPIFLLTLSCDGRRWNEQISVNGKLNKVNLSESDIINFSYQDRGNLLNNNSALVARNV